MYRLSHPLGEHNRLHFFLLIFSPLLNIIPLEFSIIDFSKLRISWSNRTFYKGLNVWFFVPKEANTKKNNGVVLVALLFSSLILYLVSNFSFSWHHPIISLPDKNFTLSIDALQGFNSAVSIQYLMFIQER